MSPARKPAAPAEIEFVTPDYWEDACKHLVKKDRVTFVLRRSATVTVSIYQGSTLVRRAWTSRALAAGTHGWTWNGRTATGAWAAPGKYRVVVDAVSWIGPSRFSRAVTVRAP